MIQRAHQRASWYGESTQGNQHCMKHSFGLVFMGRTSVGRYRPPVFFRQIALRTNPHFQADFQERKSHVTPHKHSQENKKKTWFFSHYPCQRGQGFNCIINDWVLKMLAILKQTTVPLSPNRQYLSVVWHCKKTCMPKIMNTKVLI